MAITETIKETSWLKLYKKLGIESLNSRRTVRRLWSFHKIISTGLPIYLFNLILNSTHAYQTKTLGNIPTYQCSTDTFNHSFFPWTIATWSKIQPETRNASLTVFNKHLLKEIHPVHHSFYNICYPNGLKLLTGLRLGLSHLNEIDFIITLKTVLTLCAIVFWRLSHHLTSSYTAITVTLSDIITFHGLCEVDVYLLLMKN